MKNQIIFGAFLLSSVTPSFASTWNYLFVGDDEVCYFFDADTIERIKENTTLVWIKRVRVEAPEFDGSWSTTFRWKFNCKKRTMQSLMWSTYDQNGKFIKSNAKPGSEDSVVPDSIGEGLLKVACESDFPNNKSGSSYFKIEDNDPIAATQRYFEYKKSRIDQAPK